MDTLIGLPVLVGGFILALVLGAVATKTHFCTLGAVSDWLNMNHKGRLTSWFLAIAIAVGGAALLEAFGAIALDQTRPAYRSALFAWPRYILGGLLFGIGMTLAGGCTTKQLIRLGGGSLKSLVTLLMVGLFGYLMTQTAFYAMVFHSWLAPLSLDLGRFGLTHQDLGSVLFGNITQLRLISGLLLSTLLLLVIIRSVDFRSSRDYAIGGVTVGLCVVGGWVLTGGPWGQAWQDEAQWLDHPPLGVATQSLTFVNPIGETLAFASQAGELTLLTFGVLAVIGVTLGALIYTIVAGRFRIEWFSSWADFSRHLSGGVLMGIGGVLALGCTVGQGISGLSTLAIGSILALAAIILGSATTIKIMYYRLLYEDASLIDAWLSGWVDLRLLPRSLRRLDAL